MALLQRWYWNRFEIDIDTDFSLKKVRKGAMQFHEGRALEAEGRVTTKAQKWETSLHIQGPARRPEWLRLTK